MSPVIKTIDHTATKNILICKLASRLYVELAFLPVVHISEGVALPKEDHSQLFSSPPKPCVKRPSVLQFLTVAPQSLIMHISNKVYVYKQNCCVRQLVFVILATCPQ